MKKYFEDHKYGMFLNTYHGRFFVNAMVSDIIRHGEECFRDDNKDMVPFLDYCKKNEIFKIDKHGIVMNFINYPSSIGAEELIPVEDESDG